MKSFPLKQGNLYTKKDLYLAFNVPEEKQKGAWNIGYRIYENYFFIFANIGIPGRTGHDYNNEWIGGALNWYGQTKSNIRQTQIIKLLSGNYEILVFTRRNDRDPFLYHGKGIITKVEDTTPIKVVFAFNNENKLNSLICWKALIENAELFKRNDETIYSFDNRNEYKIQKVTSQYISIYNKRENSATLLIITYKLLELFIYKISDESNILNKDDSYKLHLVESAIIQLLPILDWDFESNKVIINDPSVEKVKILFNEAENDLEYKTVERTLRIRRGQNKLRNNLLKLYNNTCCISNIKMNELLHACHLLPHATSGLNITTNAILLRSDLHDLFDSHLIGIEPKKNQICTNKILDQTEYNLYNGRTLLMRNDQKPLDRISLEYRWELFNMRL